MELLFPLMQRADLQDAEYEALLNRIVPILIKKGLKATTMDSVAAQLGMSKRTLYEIFGSKSDMLREALAAQERQNQKFFKKAFDESDNIMEALIKIFRYNRDLVKKVNVAFYKDMDRLYKDKRKEYEEARESRHSNMLKMFEKGVEEGMFRPDVDYSIYSKTMGLQMEALKRSEELFPPDIPLQRVFDTIIMGFLRGIASEKGMKILDNFTREIKN